jgi:hypothetical protein
MRWRPAWYFGKVPHFGMTTLPRRMYAAIVTASYIRGAKVLEVIDTCVGSRDTIVRTTLKSRSARTAQP